MKRFLSLACSLVFAVVAIAGILFLIVGIDSNNTGMLAFGAILALVFLLLLIRNIRKSKTAEQKNSTTSSNTEQSCVESISPIKEEDKRGIDYVVDVGKKGSVRTLMVHYKSGKVKRVRTGFDSLVFRHYAKYIKS